MTRKILNVLLASFLALGLTACFETDNAGNGLAPVVPLPPAEIGNETPVTLELEDATRAPPAGRIFLEQRDKIKLTPPTTAGTPPRPRIYGEEIDFDGTTLRFATWNVHTLTPNTAEDDKHKTKLKPLGAAAETIHTKRDAIFKILKHNGVHIAALQEIYGAPFPPPGRSGLTPPVRVHGYDIILGDPIKTQYDPTLLNDPEDAEEDPTVRNVNATQWCAIAALPEFKCEHHRTDMFSRTNWAVCKEVGPNKRVVYVGCSHFDIGALKIAGNIEQFFSQLDKPNPSGGINGFMSPRIPGNGIGGDNLIFGVDANSSPFSTTNPWNDHDDKWCCNVPGQISGPSELHLPKIKDYNGTSTKFAKQGAAPNQRPYISNNPDQRNIDFIGHRLKKPEIEYMEGSMAALNLELMHDTMNAKDLWLNLYNAGDHIPVKADYEVK